MKRGTQFLMVLITGLAALAPAQNPDWQVSVKFTGIRTSFDGSETTTVTYTAEPGSPPGQVVSESFIGENPPTGTVRTTIEGTFIVQAKWVGIGNPPQDQYLKVESNATSGWIAGQGIDKALNGLEDLEVHSPVPGACSCQSFGRSSYPILILSGDTFEVQIPVKAAGEGTGGAPQASSGVSMTASVTDRLAYVFEDTGLTYHRLPGGGAVPNGFSQVSGKYEADKAYALQYLILPPEYQGSWQSRFVGQALGDWNLPLTSVDWSGMGFYWINANLNTGWTESWNTIQYASQQRLFETLYDGPDTYLIKCKLTDAQGSEEGGVLMRLHGPVEGTDSFWKAQVGPDVQLANISEAVQAGFANKVVDSASNTTMPNGMPVTFQCTSTESYQYGAQTEVSGSAGFEFEVIKANFSTAQTFTLNQEFQIQHQLGISFTLNYRKQAKLVARPFGTVKYPICSHWNQTGYSSDSNELDVIAGYIDFTVVISNAQPIPGG